MDYIKQHLREMALFAGAGGGILGGKLLGWKTVCAVEWDPYAAAILCARQNDGILENFPIWDDVQTFDGIPWRGIIDVVSGGFPCQDISAAGKGAGIDGERSGMWKHFARIIGEVRPRYAFVENSPMLVTRGLDRVLADLTKLGYDCRWGIVSAADTGAPHLRERIWIRATDTNASGIGRNERCSDREERQILHNVNRDATKSEPERKGWKCWTWPDCADVANAVLAWKRRVKWEEKNEENAEWHQVPGYGTWYRGDYRIHIRNTDKSFAQREKKYLEELPTTNCSQFKGNKCTKRIEEERANFSKYRKWWKEDPGDDTQSGVGRMAPRMAFKVDRLKATGNGQVPMAAAMAWELLK